VPKPLKNILFFNPYFEDPTLKFGFGQQQFVDSKCKFTNCLTTNNRSFLGKVKLGLDRVREVGKGL
jgi:hypothetical protein